eukprot:6059905-Prymnesium_polylepis.1
MAVSLRGTPEPGGRGEGGADCDDREEGPAACKARHATSDELEDHLAGPACSRTVGSFKGPH